MSESYSVPPVFTKQEILDLSRISVIVSYSDHTPYQIISWEGGETFYIWQHYGLNNSYELKNTWEVLRTPIDLTEDGEWVRWAFGEIYCYMSRENNAL